MKPNTLALAALALSAFTLCRADTFKSSTLLANDHVIFASPVDANRGQSFNHYDATFADFSYGRFSLFGGGWDNRGFLFTANGGTNAWTTDFSKPSKSWGGWGWGWGWNRPDFHGPTGPVTSNPPIPTSHVPDEGVTLALVGLGLVCLAAMSGRSHRIVLS